ncbi:hypothetical protein VII00023_21362 [Vibrio ichthyoenteri ATCC 700023]|uniref:Beta/gamma crystallin 'Greek key' domain-containing protein n=1 Tax=Vibrio ichthyoenteri ATCC 700023 TaxID=870968 RepID=F9S4U2_9VIBR|nr:beta/gamma crystallin-related protein [Vibrio ichthyoenteri]EGU36424.1 hypothetical protein VII00023_21362 [Vibrio ichthyoenteri ATCC 700023]
MYLNKSFILALFICPSLSFAADSVYLCTLKPFIDSFSEAGRTEEYARLNVRNSCEKQHGEGSIFCRTSEAKCERTYLGSVSVGSGNDASAVIYKYRHQTGPLLRIDGDIADLSMYRFDDDMSSFSIPRGWRVRFYVDKNYRGDYYTRDHGSFNADGFDDVISSIRIIHR